MTGTNINTGRGENINTGAHQYRMEKTDVQDLGTEIADGEPYIQDGEA